MTELTNRIRTSVGLNLVSPTGTFIEVDKLPQMEIIRLEGELNRTIHHIHVLEQNIVDLTERIEQVEENKIVEFKNNDVYEVNKHIERLEAKVALIDSSLANNRVVRFILRYINV